MSEPGCARASLHLENKGRRVVVDNDGPATRAELTVSGPDGEVSLGRVQQTTDMRVGSVGVCQDDAGSCGIGHPRDLPEPERTHSFC